MEEPQGLGAQGSLPQGPSFKSPVLSFASLSSKFQSGRFQEGGRTGSRPSVSSSATSGEGGVWVGGCRRGLGWRAPMAHQRGITLGGHVEAVLCTNSGGLVGGVVLAGVLSLGGCASACIDSGVCVCVCL